MEKLKTFIRLQLSKPGENVCYPKDWLSRGYVSKLSLFGLSSFSYAALAGLMVTRFENNYNLEPKVEIPIHYHAFCLFLQSIVTFIADVLYTDVPSIWHPIDRVCATFNLVFFASSMMHISWAEVVIFSLAIPSCVSFLATARVKRVGEKFWKLEDPKRTQSLISYARWHAMWHFSLPIFALLWLCFRESADEFAATLYFIGSILLAVFSVYASNVHHDYFEEKSPEAILL